MLQGGTYVDAIITNDMEQMEYKNIDVTMFQEMEWGGKTMYNEYPS